ncbi:MAG: PDZ domain-containing protein [Chloroflexota bacterium]|nr:PDZ domain-containing protein [Chloroflexota bacterium]
MAGNRLVQVGVAVAALLAVVGAVGFLIAAADSSDSTTASAAALATGSQPGSLSSSNSAQQEEEKPWLGVMLAQTPDGVTIAQVIAESPADTAGLQRGDVIEAIDGTEIDNVSEFRDQLDVKNVGDTITLSISRDGQAQDISVALEARPEPLPRPIPMLPELESIAPDELFGHVLGGEFDFTDEQGNPVTAVLQAGTVASVDADAGTLTVNLNAGGTKTYKVEDDDFLFGGGLADLEEGDNVTVMTVNDDVRAVFAGGRLPFIPGMGGKHGGFGFGHGRFGNSGFWDGGHGRFSVPDAAPKPAASGTEL